MEFTMLSEVSFEDCFIQHAKSCRIADIHKIGLFTICANASDTNNFEHAKNFARKNPLPAR